MKILNMLILFLFALPAETARGQTIPARVMQIHYAQTRNGHPQK
jgi:hypothetical protein